MEKSLEHCNRTTSKKELDKKTKEKIEVDAFCVYNWEVVQSSIMEGIFFSATIVGMRPNTGRIPNESVALFFSFERNLRISSFS